MIEITDINASGAGVGRKDGVVIFVPGTIPGEQAEIQVVSRKKSYQTGAVREIIKPSPHRRTPPCPYSSECGGCPLMHMDYSAQCKAKESLVQSTVTRLAKLDFKVNPIVGADTETGYRNKAAFAVKDGKIGYYHTASHSIVEIKSCPLADDSINAVLKAMRPFVKDFKGTINHVVVRSTDNAVMVTVVTDKKSFPYKKELISTLAPLNVASINVNYCTNPKHILGARTENIFGAPTIPYTISGNTFDVSPTAFLQVNTSQTQKLYSLAIDSVDLAGRQVIDGYCGIGTISLALARKAAKVTGVELNPDSIKNATAAAKANGITNAEFICGRCEDVLTGLLKSDDNPVLFVDPPRSGMEKSLTCAIGQSSVSDLVYISCDPATLSRDIKLLTEQGFAVKSITPVDMFPNTAHVETVCLLSRKAQ